MSTTDLVEELCPRPEPDASLGAEDSPVQEQALQFFRIRELLDMVCSDLRESEDLADLLSLAQTWRQGYDSAIPHLYRSVSFRTERAYIRFFKPLLDCSQLDETESPIALSSEMSKNYAGVRTMHFDVYPPIEDLYLTSKSFTELRPLFQNVKTVSISRFTNTCWKTPWVRRPLFTPAHAKALTVFDLLAVQDICVHASHFHYLNNYTRLTDQHGQRPSLHIHRGIDVGTAGRGSEGISQVTCYQKLDPRPGHLVPEMYWNLRYLRSSIPRRSSTPICLAFDDPSLVMGDGVDHENGDDLEYLARKYVAGFTTARDGTETWLDFCATVKQGGGLTVRSFSEIEPCPVCGSK